MKSYREVERKFLITAGTFSENCAKLQSLNDHIAPDRTLACETQDDYWCKVDGETTRLRNSRGNFADGRFHHRKEITVKKKDREDNTDRFEVNVGVESVLDARAFVTFLLGKPTGRVHKEEFVLFGEGLLVLSLYQVNGEAQYLEIEAEDLEAVDEELRKLRKHFELKQEGRSLYEIFIG
jgi:hypothetical protein